MTIRTQELKDVPTILEVSEVTKSYPRRAGVLRRRVGTIQAVDGVSCTVQRGERLGLVGESGCGKTTLAKLMVGLMPPTSGEVWIGGRSLADARGAGLRELRAAVQFIFQDPVNSLNPRMSVEEILEEPLIVHQRGSKAERRQRIAALLEAVQLPEAHRRRVPRQLSGGERQRIGIARALALDPQAIICDEPIAALDVSVGAQILQLLSELSRARGMALVFISHDLRAVAWLCERIAVMRQGRILETAATGTLLSAPQNPYTTALIRSAALDLDSEPSGSS